MEHESKDVRMRHTTSVESTVKKDLKTCGRGIRVSTRYLVSEYPQDLYEGYQGTTRGWGGDETKGVP